MSDEKTELREKLNKLVIELDRLGITLDSPVSNMTVGEYEQEREKLLDGFIQAIAATLGSEQPPVDKLIRCLENDYGITASWDGLRKVWLTERATLGRGECELHDCEGSFSALNRPVWRCDCGAFMTQYTDATTYHKPRFCPNCGRKAVSA